MYERYFHFLKVKRQPQRLPLVYNYLSKAIHKFIGIPFAKSWIFRGQILTDIAEMNFKGWMQI